MCKDKLSQTGWKLHQNFRSKAAHVIDERDRIDLLANNGHVAQI